MSEELVPRDSHLVTDPQGIIQSANQEAADMLNLSQRALIGRHLPALLALDEYFQFHLQKLEKTESGLEWEINAYSEWPREFFRMAHHLCDAGSIGSD